MALVVKNLPVDAGDIRDAGSIPGLGRSTYFSILAWRITWIEEPGRLQLQRVRCHLATEHHHRILLELVRLLSLD